MKKSRLAGFASTCACLFLTSLSPISASAVTVVTDNFNDGVIDSAWVVSYQNITNWYQGSGGCHNPTWCMYESGGEFRNEGPVPQYTNNNTWSYTRLTQTFSSNELNEFDASINGWYDSIDQVHYSGANSPRAMQQFYIRLFDSSGNTIVKTGIHDAWYSNSGSMETWIGASSQSTGAGTMPMSGGFSIDLSRDATGLTSVQWDIGGGSIVQLYTGITSNLIAGVELGFGFYDYINGDGYDSFFGQVAIDNVSVSGLEISTVPIPATAWLFGSGLLGLVGIARKKAA